MPNDIYFNEVENQQKTIFQKINNFFDNFYTIPKKQRFLKQVKTDNIESLVTVNTYPVASANKNITINISGRVVTLSASAFNSLRQSTGTPTDINFPDVFLVGSAGTATVATQYNSSNNIIIFAAGGRSSKEGRVTIKNLTTGITIIDNVFFTGPSFPGSYFYYTTGAGLLEIITSTDVSNPPQVYVRRCKYPILEDDPVKVYDPLFIPTPGGGGGVFIDYGQTTKRKITLSDIDNFRIG
jgi:hypothetical protein